MNVVTHKTFSAAYRGAGRPRSPTCSIVCSIARPRAVGSIPRAQARQPDPR
jgi:hypothetical protein